MKWMLASTCVLLVGCPRQPETPLWVPIEAPAAQTESGDDPIQPIPVAMEQDQRKVSLGERLFASPILSADGKSSCTSCHPLDGGGADGLVYSTGIGGKVAALNTPTIFNVGLSFRLDWNGAFSSLESHLDRPLSGLMGSSVPEVVHRLRSDLGWQQAFAAVYPDGITEESLRDAVATYQRSLITPNSRFDRYLRGDDGALNAEEKQGYSLFKEYGCTSCHQGVNVGGNMFQRFGVMRDYFSDRKQTPSQAELGRYNVTAQESDRFVFRVPSLRNVALTAPYFHDGSAPTLESAVAVMARYQLGRTLPGDHLALIATFLRTLTGEFRGKVLR